MVGWYVGAGINLVSNLMQYGVKFDLLRTVSLASPISVNVQVGSIAINLGTVSLCSFHLVQSGFFPGIVFILLGCRT
jgi:hypothetical protein